MKSRIDTRQEVLEGGISSAILKAASILSALALFLLASPGIAVAGGDTLIDSGDTAWVLVSTALVMLMTPGLAFFYAGMARKKNVLGTIMQSYFILCLIGIQWVVWGYSLSFGNDLSGLVGGLQYLGFVGVGVEPNGTIPHVVFAMFQGMFAVITVALITGAVAERIKFSAVIIFSLLWTTFVYDPLCHWVWGGGWLGKLGAMDFAGGIVVHISCGVSAIVAALVIGNRKGFQKEPMPPHNLGLTVIGMGLLWFGWFGFNAGSALGANGQAGMALMTTNTAAAVGTLTWVFIEWAHRGKPTLLGAVSGTVAGLGSITPAAGFVGVGSALTIGIVGGVTCYVAVTILKPMLRYDDSLDVFGIHGISGIWGSLAVGIFSSMGGVTGALFGNPSQLFKQFVAVVVTVILSAVGTYLILKFVNVLVGLRVTEEEERMGLDLSEHGENGYNLF